MKRTLLVLTILLLAVSAAFAAQTEESKAQDVKKVVDALNEQGREELL